MKLCRPTWWVAVGVLSGLSVVAPAAATTYTIYPTDDVCVPTDHTDWYGEPLSMLLTAGYDWYPEEPDSAEYYATFLRFDLTSFADGTIDECELYMTSFEYVPAGGVLISHYRVTGDDGSWSEDLVTWDMLTSEDCYGLVIADAPEYTVTVAGTQTTYMWDVEPSALVNQGGCFTLCLMETNQPTPGYGAKFYSRSAGEQAYRPQLVIQYTAPSGGSGPRTFPSPDPEYWNSVIVNPAPGSTHDIYVGLDCLDQIVGVDELGVYFLRSFGGTKLSQTCLLGGVDLGDVEVDGWLMSAGADCAYPGPNGILIAGVVEYLYLGPPGTIMLLPHPVTGRTVLNCDGIQYDYCVLGNVGFGMEPEPGDPDCGCGEPSPVRRESWGVIKAMYR